MDRTEELAILAAKHIGEPEFMTLLKEFMDDFGMTDQEIASCLDAFLPRVFEQVAKRLH